jgi:hypothetical protein
VGTTFQQGRPGGIFGKRFTASFAILALVALVIVPAAAQPPGAGIVTSHRGAVDGCRFVPRVSFAAESPSIGLGSSTNLSWSVQTRPGCVHTLSMIVLARPQINLSPGAPQDWAIWTSSIGVPGQPQGSVQVQPAFNTLYLLIVAWGPNSAIYSAPVQVAVTLPVANRTCFDVANPLSGASEERAKAKSRVTAPTGGRAAGFALARPCRNRVTIDANNLAPLLVQALETPNTTVIVADGVALDLTPHLGDPQQGGAITIANGVQLIGGRVAEPGKRFQPGPLLFVTPNSYISDTVSDSSFYSHWPDPLFLIAGDNVRISGVRLQGPGPPPDAWRAQVVRPQCPSPSPCALGYTKGINFTDQLNIEIDHNELFGWNTAAVEAIGNGTTDRVWQMWTSQVTGDSSGIHYPSGPEPVDIHDNYFHDNWYPTTPVPGSACSPTNRDACMPYFGYGIVASGTHLLIERNVFNDYFHAIAANGCPGSGYRAYTNLVLANGGGTGEQAFDAHYRRPSCGVPSSAAGHDFDVRWNSFLYSEWAAIYLNGTPDVGAFVSSNVFTNDHVKEDAVRLGNGGNWGKVWLDGTNLEGVKSWSDASHFSAVCDFDGDGINDSFVTTGETWWFQSGDQSNGPTPWVYLNTNTLLVDNVSLGYFSTDAVHNHVCDVATIDGGYKGGTGQYGPLN